MSEAIHSQKLQSILHAYLQAIDRGDKPDRQAILDAHPDLRDELQAYFADASKLEHLAASLRTVDASAATPSPSLGTVRYVGDYELLDEIARGGMGVVYRARQVSLNRVVALKMILKGEFANEADVRRFRQEAEAAANLDHPNIVPIYEVGEHDGQQYFSMKLITTNPSPGRQPGVVPRDIAQRLAKVARAVHHAHQRGILHRDLKPSNILVDATGEPHVADFGLAKKVEGGDDATRSGAIVGTPAYMAPEQARAEKSLTVAADVYSLGAILYEWLTGKPPFRGDDALSTLLKVINDEPVSVRSLNPAIDRDLETICHKCLEKDPVKRYASAEALADDLDRWARGEPIHARPLSSMERLLKWSRRQPAAAALLVVSFVALVVFVAGLLWALDREHRNAQTERDLRDQAVEARTVAENAEAATREQVVRFQVRRGIEHLEQHDDFFALLWFAQALKSENRGAAYEAAHRLRLSLLLQQLPRLRAFLTEPKDLLTDVVFTLNGKQLRTAGYHQGLRLWNANGGEPLGEPIATQKQEPFWGRFVANGELVLYESVDRDNRQPLSLWDARDGKLVLSEDLSREPAGDRIQMMVTPDPERWLKVTKRQKEAVYEVLDLRTLKPTYPPMKIERDLGVPSIGPGGKQIAFLTEERKGSNKQYDLHLYDLSTGKPVCPAIIVAESQTHRHEYRSVHFSPDGKYLLTDLDADYQRRVRFWDAAKGQPLTPQLLPTYSGVSEYDPFSTKSDAFFIQESQVGLRLHSWDEFGLRLGREGTPIRPPGNTTQVVHGPKGDSLATVSGNTTAGRQAGAEGSVIGLWSPAGKLLHPYLHLPSDRVKLRFSPDGHQLASLTDHRQVVVWNMAPPGVTVPPELPESHKGKDLAFSPDGKLVAIGTVEWDEKKKKALKATVRVFDTATGKPISPAIIPNHPESTTPREILPGKTVFSPDGKRLATLCEGRGKPLERYFDIRVWDVATGEPTSPPFIGKGFVRTSGIFPDEFTFTPDGRWLTAKFSDQTTGMLVYVTRVWDAQTGKPFDPGVPYDFAAFSDDGSRVLLAQNEVNFMRWDPELKKIQPRPATILDTRTGQPLGPPITLPQFWVWRACFSPDGECVALQTHGASNSTHIFEVRTGKPVVGPFDFSEIDEHPFSPDGRRIACANRGRDKIRVFDAVTGEPLSPMIQLAGQCNQVRFAANGLAMITLSNQQVQLWHAHTGAPLASAIPSPGYSLNNDRKLTVRAPDSTMRFLDLKPIDWPAGDIVRLAELLACHRIDEFSNLLPLNGEEIRERWNELWPRYHRLTQGSMP